MLQEVFAASYNAIRADEREINVRPWLYRIARNRCLNHLRRPTPGRAATRWTTRCTATASRPPTSSTSAPTSGTCWRTSRSFPRPSARPCCCARSDALSYDQIAEAMETTVPSVKSLLVRARMSLAEAAEARQLTCDDVRLRAGRDRRGPQEDDAADQAPRARVRAVPPLPHAALARPSTAMAIAFPVGPLLILKKLSLAKLGAARWPAERRGGRRRGRRRRRRRSGGARSRWRPPRREALPRAGLAAGGAGAAAGAGAAPALGAVATKAITVTAATALLAGGAVEVKKISGHAAGKQRRRPAAAQAPPLRLRRTGGGLASARLPAAIDKLQGGRRSRPTPRRSRPQTGRRPGHGPTTAGATGADGGVRPAPPADGPTTPPGEGATGNGRRRRPAVAALSRRSPRPAERPRRPPAPAARRHSGAGRSRHRQHRPPPAAAPGPALASSRAEAEASERALQHSLVADPGRRVGGLVERGREHRDQQAAGGVCPGG